MRNRILVVDDEPGLRRAVERVLAKRYELSIASTPEEAIRTARTFRPEVAILDIRMPGMDGYELMAKLKEMDPYLDVILMTGSLNDSDVKLIRAIREKAFYYIEKPFDRDVLLTIVERCLELHRLAGENRRYLERLEAELAQARAFQQSLLPHVPAKRHSIRFDASYAPCDELGGDFFDHAAAGANRAAFLLADVSGHGAAAAMLTGIVKSAFQSLRNRGSDPKAVVERITSGLRTFDESRFVTIFCGRIDTEAGTLDYVNAGHPPGLAWNSTGASDPAAVEVQRLVRTGPMVFAGIDEPMWKQQTIPFPPGSRLLLYSDGIIEARDEDDFFGLERLEGAVREHAADEPPVVLRGIIDHLDRFAKGRPRDDDVTVLHVASIPDE